MRKLVVTDKYNNKKLNNFILDTFSNLNKNVLFKALRQKDIKINGKRVKENVDLKTGDEIEVFISDELLFGKTSKLNKVFEDDNILIIYKEDGISVTNEKEQNQITLTNLVKKEFGENVEPCHRLDRNTKGLVLFAKNDETLNILLKKFKNHEIEKHYKALVYGILKKEHEILKDYLFKDSKNNIVYVSDIKKTGYQEIITEYNVISKNNDNTTLLDINLHTGRTHQIRAHLAYIGYPIIGDGKYGNNEINKKFGKKVQELTSYKLIFNFKTPSGILEYLNGIKIEI